MPVAVELQAAAPADPLLEQLRNLLPILQAQLRDPNVQVRLGAIEVLETLGNVAEPVEPALIQATCDPNRFVRWGAVRTLGKLGPIEPSAAVPAIARLLFDADLDVRLSAATALDRFGPAAEPAVPDLIRALQASDDVEREAAIQTLSGIGTGAQAAIPALAAAVINPGPGIHPYVGAPRIRQLAAEVLGRFGPRARSAVPALRRALEDPDPDVRRAASDALLSILQAGSGL